MTVVAVIVTVAVPLLPLESVAVTANVPVVEPAVYRPLLVMVPPVADHVTARPALSVAVNCWVPPGRKLVDEGLTVTVTVPPVTVIFVADVKTVPVVASFACTSIRCAPFVRLTVVSNTLVLC